MEADHFTTADGRFHGLFFSIPHVGELWVERDAVVRGRRWLDTSRHRNSLEVFAGQAYVVLSASRLALVTGLGLLTLMGLEVAGVTDLIP